MSPFLTLLSRDIRLAWVVVGAMIACAASMLLAYQALEQIRLRPGELTGKGMVAATMIAGAIGILGGAAALWLRFGETLVQGTKQLFR